MPSVVYSECRILALYTERHNAACYNSDCHYAEFHYAEFHYAGRELLSLVRPKRNLY
jgi:hypothetical protein